MHTDTKRLLIVSAMVLGCFIILLGFKNCNVSSEQLIERAYGKIEVLQLENDSLKLLIKSNEQINQDVVNAPVLNKHDRDSLFILWEKQTGLDRYRKPHSDNISAANDWNDSIALEDCEQTVAILQKDIDELNVVYEKTILIAKQLQYKTNVQGTIMSNDSAIIALQQNNMSALKNENADQKTKLKRKNKTIAKLIGLSIMEVLAIAAIIKS